MLLLLLFLPFLELWAAVAVAGRIGFLPALASIVALSMLGVWLLRRQGWSVWRRVNAELAAGRRPTTSLLDGALALLGGLCLVIPGFITAALGALLVLPPVRALLRPLLVAWMSARVAKAVRSGRLRATYVEGHMGSDGRLRTRSQTFGDVVDAEGWDLDDPRPELDRPESDPGPDGPPEDRFDR